MNETTALYLYGHLYTDPDDGFKLSVRVVDATEREMRSDADPTALTAALKAGQELVGFTRAYNIDDTKRAANPAFARRALQEFLAICLEQSVRVEHL